MLVVIALMLLSSIAAGCGTPPPPAAGRLGAGVSGRGRAVSGGEGARVEVETESGTVAGKLGRGAHLVIWAAPKMTGLFVLRIYDAQGKELFRWAPTSGPAAA